MAARAKVGDIVHYTDQDGDGPLAAIVTAVEKSAQLTGYPELTNGEVHLMVFGVSGVNPAHKVPAGKGAHSWATPTASTAAKAAAPASAPAPEKQDTSAAKTRKPAKP